MNQLGARQPAAVESYLAEVVVRLPGPRRTHSGIVAELRSGLLDATDSYASAGLPPAEAAAAAIREFGDPGLVADAFLPEITASQARRAAVLLLATGPLVGLLWLATAVAGHLAIRTVMLWEWNPLGAGFRLIAVAIAVTALAGAAGMAATGRLTRWLPPSPRRAPLAAAIAGFGAIGADGAALLLFAATFAAAPGRLSPLLAATAAAASVARILLAMIASRRCLTLRATVASQ